MAELQFPDVVGNYLSSYYGAQQQQRAQQQQEMAKRQDQRAEQSFGVDMDAKKLDMALKQTGAIYDLVGMARDEPSLAQAKQQAVQMGLPADRVNAITLKDIPRIRMETGQALKELQMMAQKANIAQSYAAADASRATADKVRNSNGGIGSIDNTTFDNMSGLRKEFVGNTKTYSDVRDAYGRIQASAKNPSAAGDLSLIFNYMKVLDPGSTVREGEFANAQNATGIPQQIVNAYNRAINGTRLNDEQRKDFVNRAGLLFNRQHETYLKTKENYERLAQRFGFDPSLVTFDLSGGIIGPGQTPSATPPQSFSGSGVFTNNIGSGQAIDSKPAPVWAQ